MNFIITDFSQVEACNVYPYVTGLLHIFPNNNFILFKDWIILLWLHYILITHLSIHGHLDFFHVLTTENYGVVNMDIFASPEILL